MKMSEERPRQRQNLDRLLKFCVENTLAEDPGDRSSSSIEPERQAWLQEALKNFTGEDEVSLIKKCLMLLSTPFGELSADPEEDFMTRENALEQIESVVDNIDNAKDCFKLGGLDVFLKYIDDNMHCTLQWQALSVLGSCLQNNAYCQEQALKINILSRLLKIVDGDFGDTTVNVKAVYALGCMIRGCEEAERQFIEKDGFSYLLRAVERNVPKLNIKAIFLISNLTDETKKILKLYATWVW
ncbi:hsp70-binding protein 1-like isoform X2 [Xenia sp. Carnegie-2017]|uniref:hsp70-binding protein 1-like isoform X2 n=1 Tax=Xenia sp. Carnegie-2017 TaxID=2897299 RepID=UPI001F03E8DA|nr:hsp70-binding protein 1-like isoform X2 [Xenia sp. Carnegie-2017]